MLHGNDEFQRILMNLELESLDEGSSIDTEDNFDLSDFSTDGERV